MAESLTELVDRAYAALNRRDLDAFVETNSPEIEIVSLIAESEGAVYRGHDGLREWWEMVGNSLGGIRFTAQNTTELSDELVLVDLLVTGEVAGVEVSQRMWQTIEIRDGKAIWWQAFRTEEEARQALEARRR